MRPKHPSLQQHAKQSHSINVHEIQYSDYIDQQVKQNQITPFQSLHPQNTFLKQLNSNQQNQRSTHSIDKSNIDSGEIKLYRERIQTLQNRLKEKNHQFKMKQQEIMRLNMLNQQLQQQKLQFLLQPSQKSLNFAHKITKQFHEQYVQTQAEPLKTHSYSTNHTNSTHPPSQLQLQQSTIQLHFQLEKYKQKYIIIEQNLKKRVHQHQSQLSSLQQKLKSQKLLNNHLQQQIFSLQQQNINLKQKLQQAFDQIESFELQRQQINQQMPLTHDLKKLENNGRRFPFGDDFKQVIAPHLQKHQKPQKHLFLSIFNEVSFSFVPETNQQTGRFKGQDIHKRSNYMIRIYPRLYEIKVIGNMKTKGMIDKEQTSKHKLVESGCNTVQKKLYMSASVNIKVAVPSNAKPLKQKRNLRICSREVFLNPTIFIKSQTLRQQIPEPIRKPQSYEPIMTVNQATLNYKINTRNTSENSQRNPINAINTNYQKLKYDRQREVQDYRVNLQRAQNTAQNNDLTRLNSLTHYVRPQMSPQNQNIDILHRINHHLKNSNLMSPKVQNADHLSSRQQSLEHQYPTRSRPKIAQLSHLQTRHEYAQSRTNIPHKTQQKINQLHYKPEHTYSDWIVDQINEETNKILSKYTPVNTTELTYHQNYPRVYHTQKNIEKSRDYAMKRSSSIQNIHQPQRTGLTMQNEKALARNMSLTSLDQIKPRQSLPKSNTLRLNTTSQCRPSLQLNKTQQIKESRMVVPVTPSRQQNQKVNPSISMKDLIAQKCKKLSIN